MHDIHIKVTDTSKVDLLIRLLREFDFVEIVSVSKHEKKPGEESILDSAGIWKDRDVDAEELRKRAWRRDC